MIYAKIINHDEYGDRESTVVFYGTNQDDWSEPFAFKLLDRLAEKDFIPISETFFYKTK